MDFWLITDASVNPENDLKYGAQNFDNTGMGMSCLM